MDEIDIWRSADQMMKLYQGGAEMAAADRADARLDQGDIKGFEVWTRVVWAIRDLAYRLPLKGEFLN